MEEVRCDVFDLHTDGLWLEGDGAVCRLVSADSLVNILERSFIKKPFIRTSRSGLASPKKLSRISKKVKCIVAFEYDTDSCFSRERLHKLGSMTVFINSIRELRF